MDRPFAIGDRVRDLAKTFEGEITDIRPDTTNSELLQVVIEEKKLGATITHWRHPFRIEHVA